MKLLAVIPARSGSKGLKDKNIRPLCGKPLCAYTIEAAKAAEVFAEIFFSTDSERYAEIATQYGASVPFLRSEKFATDAASSWDVVKEAIQRYKFLEKQFDAVMLLQPTVPFRTSEDIRAAVQLLETRNGNAVVSVTEPEHTPFWCAELPADGNMQVYHKKMRYLIGRQKLPKQYILNGAIYLAKIDYLLRAEDVYQEKCYSYLMPRERSFDIDDQQDFDICETLLQKMSSSH